MNLSHQPAFRGYTAEVADKQGLKENHRIHRGLTSVVVLGPGKGIDKGEINSVSNPTEEMALRNKLVQGELKI